MDVISNSFARLKNVHYIVINQENCIIRSSGDFAEVPSNLVEVINNCRAGLDEMKFLKIRTEKCEYLVVPDEKYMLIAWSAINSSSLA